jgi:hypothetical protein
VAEEIDRIGSLRSRGRLKTENDRERTKTCSNSGGEP